MYGGDTLLKLETAIMIISAAVLKFYLDKCENYFTL